MICQQLTKLCIVMTTYNIAFGQLSYSQRLLQSHHYPRSMLSQGVLRRPPYGYHYETMRHILNTYPRNSYTIKYGLSNVLRNNNRGSFSPSKGGKKNPQKKKKSKKNKKSDDENAEGMPDDTFPPAESPPAENPPDGSPPAANPAPSGGQSAP